MADSSTMPPMDTSNGSGDFSFFAALAAFAVVVCEVVLVPLPPFLSLFAAAVGLRHHQPTLNCYWDDYTHRPAVEYCVEELHHCYWHHSDCKEVCTMRWLLG
jgi:hypothetical protein